METATIFIVGHANEISRGALLLVAFCAAVRDGPETGSDGACYKEQAEADTFVRCESHRDALPGWEWPMAEEQFEILLVEDDADTRANLCDILELDGYNVGVAGSAKEARDLNKWDKLRIIILDRKLPDAMAEELLPEIKEAAPHTDVIVVTGYGDMDSTITALKHGAADYIIKPVNPHALRKSVERILERRRIQHALHVEHELSDRILQTADASVVMLDLEGNIVRINQYLEKLSGWSLDEVRGKDWFDTFLPERDHERIRDVFRRTASDIETSGTTNPVVTKTGQERQLRWSNTTLKDEAGKTVAVLAVGIDVTELLEAQQVALQATRLAAIGETMAALAHESRNSLQRIQSGLEVLEMELEEHPTAMRDISRIERAADELRGLHEQVRTYAAPIKLELNERQIPDIWYRAWETLAEVRKGRDAELIQKTDDVPLRLIVDCTRLEQVFRNLFENSLAACEGPLRITITCSETRLKSRDAVEIRVRDNGPGLSSEQQAKIFEAFFTTKSSGTGLGMAIAQRIVEAHEGTIVVEPETEEGAEFVLTIPRF